jgi:hypothetical protein
MASDTIRCPSCDRCEPICNECSEPLGRAIRQRSDAAVRDAVAAERARCRDIAAGDGCGCGSNVAHLIMNGSFRPKDEYCAYYSEQELEEEVERRIRRRAEGESNR